MTSFTGCHKTDASCLDLLINKHCLGIWQFCQSQSSSIFIEVSIAKVFLKGWMLCFCTGTGSLSCANAHTNRLKCAFAQKYQLFTYELHIYSKISYSCCIFIDKFAQLCRLCGIIAQYLFILCEYFHCYLVKTCNICMLMLLLYFTYAIHCQNKPNNQNQFMFPCPCESKGRISVHLSRACIVCWWRI